jgi:hypothetical protein
MSKTQKSILKWAGLVSIPVVSALLILWLSSYPAEVKANTAEIRTIEKLRVADSTHFQDKLDEIVPTLKDIAATGKSNADALAKIGTDIAVIKTAHAFEHPNSPATSSNRRNP